MVPVGWTVEKVVGYGAGKIFLRGVSGSSLFTRFVEPCGAVSISKCFLAGVFVHVGDGDRIVLDDGMGSQPDAVRLFAERKMTVRVKRAEFPGYLGNDFTCPGMSGGPLAPDYYHYKAHLKEQVCYQAQSHLRYALLKEYDPKKHKRPDESPGAL
jgi:hypothetical protein